MDLKLKGKCAIVTGAGSGIGKAIAAKLLEEGARVMMCGRDAAKLDDTVAALGAGDRVRRCIADVGNAGDVALLVQETVAAFGRLDVIVSNAGTHLRGRIEELPAEDVENHFRTKVLGPWELIRAGAPHMRAAGGGRIILIIGQAGKVPGRNVPGSAVVNAAQLALVKSVSDDLGRDGILVNAVCPSRIESPLSTSIDIDEERYLGRSLEQQESGWGDTVPLGRWGTAEDIANAVAFVASERASFMNGANIDVDGGHQRMIF
ncbi:MAG: SDR family oxidoreductase [Rhodobiaceae bacterium]|nr:SDR family oxidoreductase [Rhodobiaceae bacterium]MCC0051751.1 SDR family oxidoreductase [Rhodobiaceae bacterium]MCC0060454.1 SDR family oxidoreductase [Rhodobiaceae bacterium]